MHYLTSFHRIKGRTLKQTSDESLLAQYIEGDFTAFESLYKRHKGGVFRYLSRQLHNNNVIEDLFQEVWSKVITQADSFNANAKFSTWLYTIARHKLIDHVRHMKVISNVMEETQSDDLNAVDNAVDDATPESVHQQFAQAKAIENCMQKLPVHQLDCFLLREETGLPVKDIANIVNAGLEATKSRLRNAYHSLKICIDMKLSENRAQSSVVIESGVNGAETK